MNNKDYWYLYMCPNCYQQDRLSPEDVARYSKGGKYFCAYGCGVANNLMSEGTRKKTQFASDYLLEEHLQKMPNNAAIFQLSGLTPKDVEQLKANFKLNKTIK